MRRIGHLPSAVRPLILAAWLYLLTGCGAILPSPTPTAAPRPTPTPTLFPTEVFNVIPDSVYSIWVGLIDYDENRPWIEEPQIIEYPYPDEMQLETSIREATRCSGWDQHFPECPPESPLAEFECSSLEKPSLYSGGLDKDATIVAKCTTWLEWEGEQWEKVPSVYRTGCDSPYSVTYIIFRNGRFEEISTREELAAVYAPIENDAEALGYALVATGLSAVYWLDDPMAFPTDGTFRYYTSVLEETHVIRDGEDFIVFLFHDPFCSCGPFTHLYFPVRVRRDGAIEWGEAALVYADDRTECTD